MLFMITSRPRQDPTRKQLVEHLTRKLDPSTWDLIRHGVLSHVLYKVGEEPGFFAVLQAESLWQAKIVVAAHQHPDTPFDIDIVPVNQFPHFD